MRWVNTVFMVLAALAVGTVQAQTLDCRSAFTNMEQAICSNQQLSDLFNSMIVKSEESVARRLISAEASAGMRDDLARSCSASDNLERCLLSAMSGAVRVLSIQLEGSPDAQSQLRRSSAASANLDSLASQLVEAEAHFAKTDEPKHLVATLLAVLNHYEHHATESATAIYEMRAVRAKLLSGCSDLRLRTRWNRALQRNGRACPMNLAQSSY